MKIEKYLFRLVFDGFQQQNFQKKCIYETYEKISPAEFLSLFIESLDKL